MYEIINDQEGTLNDLVIKARGDAKLKEIIAGDRHVRLNELESCSMYPKMKPCTKAIMFVEGIESKLIVPGKIEPHENYDSNASSDTACYLLAIVYMGLGEKDKAQAIKTEVDKGVGGRGGYFVNDSYPILLKALCELSLGDKKAASKTMNFLEKTFGYVEDKYLGQNFRFLRKSHNSKEYTLNDNALLMVVKKGLGVEPPFGIKELSTRFNLTYQHGVAGALRNSTSSSWQTTENAFSALCEYERGASREGDSLLYSIENLISFQKAKKGWLAYKEKGGDISAAASAAMAIAYMVRAYRQSKW